jgi:hypothetical protein
MSATDVRLDDLQGIVGQLMRATIRLNHGLDEPSALKVLGIVEDLMRQRDELREQLRVSKETGKEPE